MVVIDDDDGTTTLLAGQCCYSYAEFEERDPALEDAHAERWVAVAKRSIEQLHAFRPDVVYLSHDPSVLRRTA